MRSVDPRWREARRILAVRLDFLGDVLVTTPAFHAIKESVPKASLTLLTSSAGAQAGRLNEDIDDVIAYASPFIDPWATLPHDSSREQALIRDLKERHFDGAVIFTSFRQSPLPAAYLCYLADIPLRHAASIDGIGSLLTMRHKPPESMMHEVERGLDLVYALGMETADQDLVLTVPRQAYEEMRRELTARGVPHARPLVVVHPGCAMPARTYPWEMYADVISLLVRRLDATVIVTGGPEEVELVDRVCDHVDEESQDSVIPLAGAMPFPTFGALIADADLVVTNNTGPMHVAAALKTPVVALFALTNPPEQWGPWHVPHRQLFHDVPCRICYRRVCPIEHECLRRVSPESVVDAARELLTDAAVGVAV